MKVDVSTVAQALELSPRRVQQLASQGWIPREEAGTYALADCLEGYAAYLEEVEGRRGIGGAIDRARARKVSAQAQLQELKLAIESGDLLEGAEARERTGNKLSTCRQLLLQVPSRTAPLMAATESQERRETILLSALEDALGVLTGPSVGAS